MAAPKKKKASSSSRRRSTSVARRHTATDATPRRTRATPVTAKKARVLAPVPEPEMDPRDARDLARGRPVRHRHA
jgi:hypothetical protein